MIKIELIYFVLSKKLILLRFIYLTPKNIKLNIFKIYLKNFDRFY